MVEGYSRWKLSSGNLYIFIRPNQEELRKMAVSPVYIHGNTPVSA
jgi:hypothetical protein